MSYTVDWCYSGKHFSRKAWTGGDTPPAKYREACYRAIRSDLFREQVRECGGLDLWVCAGTSALERARIFWNRARLDAWRTTHHNEHRTFRVSTDGDVVA